MSAKARLSVHEAVSIHFWLDRSVNPCVQYLAFSIKHCHLISRGRIENPSGEGKLSMFRRAVVLIAMSFVVSAVSTAALAVSKQTAATADRDARALVRMMDRDQNGTVSKEEFLQFMGQTFDRIDANKNGSLEHVEVRRMRSPNWIFPNCRRAFPACDGGN
jgi:phosphoglycerol transferase MdoB-like AlkP superfamily enzyme